MTTPSTNFNTTSFGNLLFNFTKVYFFVGWVYLIWLAHITAIALLFHLQTNYTYFQNYLVSWYKPG